MCFVFCINVKKYDNVIHINTNKFLKFSQKSIYLTLNICKRIFIFHDNNVEKILFLMIDFDNFMFVISMYASLIKKINTIDHQYKFAFSNENKNIRL